jgi:hypothetical protein
MPEKAAQGGSLGRIFCSVSVQAWLDAAGITREELLQFHEQHHDAEAALDQPDWKCSPFPVPRSRQTLWIMTDPQQQSILLVLEEP